MTRAEAVAAVLAGRADYDDLTEPEQAAVRAAWAEQIQAARSALNFERDFRAAGESWSEADQDGSLIIREPWA